ncbi:MAG: SDR family oxidoreductase [Myxococcota bacterium]
MALWSGEVALITGAASGIGRATAIAFAAEGARVVVVDFDEVGGAGTARDIRARGGESLFVRADVSSGTEVNHLFDRVRAAYGTVDFAFNNAGIEGEMSSCVDCTEANWDRTLDVNLKAVWRCMVHELALMQRQGRGSIVNCSSIAGLVGFERLPAYVASKHGVVGLTRAAALENARRGIRVNAVCPGVIHTAMIDRVLARDPDMRRWLLDNEPVGRMGSPEEIAAAVLWLCGPGAGFVTGQAIAVDGGWVAR